MDAVFQFLDCSPGNVFGGPGGSERTAGTIPADGQRDVEPEVLRLQGDWEADQWVLSATPPVGAGQAAKSGRRAECLDAAVVCGHGPIKSPRVGSP
jgi:hypothetical protein